MAFEDRTHAPDRYEGEISDYDQSTATITRLTNDDLINTNPRVSPTGNVIVWQKCQHDGTGCAIYSAVQTGPGTFQTTLLTGAGENRSPATNGTLVAYISDKNGENDIYYQRGRRSSAPFHPPGDQRDVSISGDWIAFESQGQQVHDVLVYDLRTEYLYQVTNTPLVDEMLSEISVCNGR